MTPTQIHSVICIQDSVLIVFCTASKHWQYRVINKSGKVIGESTLYYTNVAAFIAGKESIK